MLRLGEHLAEDRVGAEVVAIAMDINGIPRRLKRSEDWAEFVLTRELNEGDLVRVERRGSESADMRAGDVPELRTLFDQIKLADAPAASTVTGLPSGDARSTKSEIVEVGDQTGRKNAPNEPTAPKQPAKKKPAVDVASGLTSTATARPTAIIAPAIAKEPSAPPPIIVAQAPRKGTRTIVAWGIGLFILASFLSRMWSEPSSQQHGQETTTPAPSSVTEYANRDVAVRNAPTTVGSTLIAMAPAGTTFTGDWVTGNNGKSNWLKVSEGTYVGDFVWAGNLSQNAPPAAAAAETSTPPSSTTQLTTPNLADAPAATGTINLPTTQTSPPPAAASPSFDCTRAKSWPETTICGNPSLIDYDNRMAVAYRALIASTAGRERHLLIVSQRQWLEQRAPCAQVTDPIACLTNLYNGRIADLSSTNYINSLVAADDTQKQAAVPQNNILSGTPNVLDSATLNINGTVVRLLGIEGIGGDEAKKMSQFIAEQGGTVTCRSDSDAYVCTTASNLDIAIAALLNGAARLTPNAPAKYQTYELQARQAARGIWANQN